jgi:hypothetical protein
MTNPLSVQKTMSSFDLQAFVVLPLCLCVSVVNLSGKFHRATSITGAANHA